MGLAPGLPPWNSFGSSITKACSSPTTASEEKPSRARITTSRFGVEYAGSTASALLITEVRSWSGAGQKPPIADHM